MSDGCRDRNSSLDFEFLRAISEALLLHVEFVEERQQPVRHLSMRGSYDVPAALQFRLHKTAYDTNWVRRTYPIAHRSYLAYPRTGNGQGGIGWINTWAGCSYQPCPSGGRAVGILMKHHNSCGGGWTPVVAQPVHQHDGG